MMYFLFPEDQVCDVVYSKILKGLGTTQDTVFYWEGNEDDYYSLMSRLENEEEIDDGQYAAYTVSELEKLLPVGFNVRFQNGKKRSRDHQRKIGRYKHVPSPYYAGYGGGHGGTNFEERDEKMANAMAKLLIEICQRTLTHKALEKKT